jgi:uncharacterized protein YndB with AHSA1/START domain
MNEQTAAQAATRQVDLSRVYAAPREAVFRAWTDPDQVASWWGPDGFDAPRDKIAIEPRVGGRFHVVMTVADPAIATGMGVPLGTEFPDSSEIVELVEGELIVLRHAAQPEIGIPFEAVTRVAFADAGDGRTRVTVSSGPYAEAMAHNAERGWTQQLGKLERLLAGA